MNFIGICLNINKLIWSAWTCVPGDIGSIRDDELSSKEKLGAQFTSGHRVNIVPVLMDA